MDEEKGINWKVIYIIGWVAIIIITFFITKSIARMQTISEIYDYIDVQFNDCIKSCGVLMPSWVNIRQGIAECMCLDVISNGNKTNNQIPTGDK